MFGLGLKCPKCNSTEIVIEVGNDDVKAWGTTTCTACGYLLDRCEYSYDEVDEDDDE